MSNSHHEKFVVKLLVGIALIIGGIFIILYASFTRTEKDDWYLWAILSSAAVISGLLLSGSALIHKIKSDLIRKQRHREHQKTFTTDKIS